MAVVESVSAGEGHRFSKPVRRLVNLVAGEGVAGDAHRGVTVKHRSRVKADPTQPNLRQVHLIHAELLDELAGKGFTVRPGDIGENVLTRGIDLLALPVGAELGFPSGARIRITGLRNPCAQLDRHAQGLLAAVLDRDAEGRLVRKAGIMGVVVTGGVVRPGDAISVTLPPPPHRRLERV
jgi:MOSC domain-containing protein YiiM